MHRKKYLVHRVHNKIRAVFLPCSPFPFCLCGPHPSLVCFLARFATLCEYDAFLKAGYAPRLRVTSLKKSRHWYIAYILHILTYTKRYFLFYLSIYLSNLIYPIYLSVYLSVYLSIYLSVCLSIPSIHPSIHVYILNTPQRLSNMNDPILNHGF